MKARVVLEELEALGCQLEPDLPLTIRVPGVEGDYAYRWHAGTGTLQPLETQKEEYLMHFDTDTEEVEFEATLSYFISGKKGDIIYSVKKNVMYDND